MKKIIYIINIAIFICILFILTACNLSKKVESDGKFKIVTSFYPIYIATLNIVDNAENVVVENMTNNQVGCLHEYTLKTDDMMKVENANVLILNGKGLESFKDRVSKTYKNLEFIDSSEGIETDNPHIWVNAELYIKQIENISNKLIELNPENKTVYEKNTIEYIEKIRNELKKMNITENISAITFNETLEYISDKINLKVIETGHEETALSATELAGIIDTMKNEDIKVIFVDKNESYRNAETLKNETGATIYELDSYTKGENDKDAYLDSLRKNIEVLNKMR